MNEDRDITPDDLFRRAETLADRLGIPRSQLFAKRRPSI